MNEYHIYILASEARGTLYIGVTSNLSKRIDEHRASDVRSFTKKYHAKRLVYFETFDNPEFAIAREKQLKNWHRQWKINLIESLNPNWDDLTVLLHGS